MAPQFAHWAHRNLLLRSPTIVAARPATAGTGLRTKIRLLKGAPKKSDQQLNPKNTQRICVIFNLWCWKKASLSENLPSLVRIFNPPRRSRRPLERHPKFCTTKTRPEGHVQNASLLKTAATRLEAASNKKLLDEAIHRY